MGSSPGFGPTADDWALRPRAERGALLGLAFAAAPALRLNLAANRNSPVHYAKGTPSLRRLRQASIDMELRPLVGTRFQVLFHSPPGVLFTVPSRYLSAIGRKQYLALGDGPPGFPQGFTCPVVLGNPIQGVQRLSPTGLSPSLAHRPRCLRLDVGLVTPRRRHSQRPTGSRNTWPATPVGYDTRQVWAVPRSLATTWGIAIAFSSSGYLDVSVPPLTSAGLWIYPTVTRVDLAGLPHSGTPGSQAGCASPGHFAASRALHRLLPPEHPPCALGSLSKSPKQCSCRATCVRLSRKSTTLGFCVSSLLYSIAKVRRPESGRVWYQTLLSLSTLPRRWWRRADSNRRHPACKAGALPTELRPRGESWWASVDSNHAPQPYQGCALTN
jgi:hypothetical protein